MASIVVPAHNEESVIARSIAALLQQVSKDDEIIVVCNGCTDQTAHAASISDRVKVFVSPVPSKINALNLGDEQATQFPRIYADADVVLSPGSINVIEEVLNRGYMAAAPTAKMDTTRASWAVRAYYRIWLRTPYVRAGMMGGGVYALSEAGRQRFDRFPDIIADDGYVRALFKEHERCRVPTAIATVRAPATLADLIKIKTRSRLGVYQLHQRYPELVENETKDYGGTLSTIVSHPRQWLDGLVYIYVNLRSRWRARRQLKANFQGWERDDSSRI